MLKSLLHFHFMSRQVEERSSKGWKNVTLDDLTPQLTYVEQFINKLWVAPVLLGAAFGYPLQVIGINVIYSRFNFVAKNRTRYRNSLSAAKEIYLKYGHSGFYRGFVPGMLSLTYLYKDNLSILFADKYFWEAWDDFKENLNNSYSDSKKR